VSSDWATVSVFPIVLGTTQTVVTGTPGLYVLVPAPSATAWLHV